MRLLAGYKLLLGLLLAVVAFELVRLIDEDLVAVVHEWILRLHADPHHPMVLLVVRKVSSVRVETLEDVAILTGVLGGLHLVEGVGLWLEKALGRVPLYRLHLCIHPTGSSRNDRGLSPAQFSHARSESRRRLVSCATNQADEDVVVISGVGVEGGRTRLESYTSEPSISPRDVLFPGVRAPLYRPDPVAAPRAASSREGP